MHTTTPPGTASRSTEAEETTAITTITSGNTKIALPIGTETQKMIQQKEQYHQHQEQENQQHKHRQQQISNIKKKTIHTTHKRVKINKEKSTAYEQYVTWI